MTTAVLGGIAGPSCMQASLLARRHAKAPWSASMPPALSGEGNTLARISEGLAASAGSSKASSSSLRTPSR
ncbi:hypothetical protein DD238_008127 [Peronospora effusa]|uniref:Uncharacterized protein n=1 Tax=Peronospora effusa TaxID=542832 RepID=A0A3M6V701_9STRA|nr:hypothetical protein DD238_008311 [Peronospora effusa]RMX62378.1 hypothetical protein DD238_008127 [Peronospora effusa]